jgi:hypothetical protein
MGVPIQLRQFSTFAIRLVNGNYAYLRLHRSVLEDIVILDQRNQSLEILLIHLEDCAKEMWVILEERLMEPRLYGLRTAELTQARIVARFPVPQHGEILV